MTPPIKAEQIDEDTYDGEESQDDIQFFPE